MIFQQFKILFLSNLFIVLVALIPWTTPLHDLLQWLALAGIALFSLSALYEPKMKRRIDLVWIADVFVFMLFFLEESLYEGNVVIFSWIITQVNYLSLRALIEKVQYHEGDQFFIGSTRGLVQKYPQHTGLAQLFLLLFSCVPGSALFFLEDMGIESLIEHSWLAVWVVLICMGVLAIALWDGFVHVFLGRAALEHDMVREDGLLLFRIVALCSILCGVLPTIWAKAGI